VPPLFRSKLVMTECGPFGHYFSIWRGNYQINTPNALEPLFIRTEIINIFQY